jgi:hypothetical protein
MGEVYKARDTKLACDVAINVLLAAMSKDPERLARFESEAKVLAPLCTLPNLRESEFRCHSRFLEATPRTA